MVVPVVVVSLIAGFNRYVDEKIAGIGAKSFTIQRFRFEDFKDTEELDGVFSGLLQAAGGAAEGSTQLTAASDTAVYQANPNTNYGATTSIGPVSRNRSGKSARA